MSLTVKAVILAAGRSKRLGELTENIPKCLLPLGSTTILDHQLENLRQNNIRDITLVTGFCENLIRQHCGNSVYYISNPVFEKTNSIYSLWLALKKIPGDVVVLNSDVVFHPALLTRLMQSGYQDALTVCFQDGMGDEEMKVRVRDDRIYDISKDMDPKQADGENVGLLKFSTEGRTVLFNKIDELVRAGVVNVWAPFAFREICSSFNLYAIDTDGLPWIEIDFPEDLLKAREEVYPKICASISKDF